MADEADFEKTLIEEAVRNGWEYVPASKVPRSADEVIVGKWFCEAVRRLNPGLSLSQAEETLGAFRAFALSTNAFNLIVNNETFIKKLFEENSFPFGRDASHVAVDFIDFENIEKNRFVVTNQWIYPHGGQNGKRLDLVFLVNGIPLAVGELKSPTRPAISWVDGAQDILGYQSSVAPMFVANALSFATEGKTLRYGSIGAPLTKWGPWFGGIDHAEGCAQDVLRSFNSLMKPCNVLDLFRYFSIFSTDRKFRKVKILARYQQVEGANAIVDRVKRGYPKQGLIWHFQGSGKSWLIVFAARKLRASKELKSPTVMVIDDRIDLKGQISSDFIRSGIPNFVQIDTKENLKAFFDGDQRKIAVATIFLFNKMERDICTRDNVILLVDEAHRTQEGTLGATMRAALPNAFFFGLTGTPINRLGHNTFTTFGAAEDSSGYMSKYSFSDSIRDGATLKLEFQSVPVKLHVNKELLEEDFEKFVEENNVTNEDKAQLVKRTRVEAFFTAPGRVREVCTHIVRHFREQIEPTGLKAQVVCFNRNCCVEYKKAIDALLGCDDKTTIVMTTGADKEGKYKKWDRSSADEEKLLNRFRDPMDPLKIVIVTSKLLTGFDAPILQCMYLDKPMRDHTLLQAICRTNRVYDTSDAQKNCGLIVDYVGIFDDVANALSFDDEQIRNVISNIDEIRKAIPVLLQKCLSFFPGVDRNIGGYEGLLAAQEKLPNEAKRDEFAAEFSRLHKAWETVSPHKDLAQYENDYAWLANVFQSIKPISGNGAIVWKILGPKTIELIHRHITAIDIPEAIGDGDVLTIDADVINGVMDKIAAKKKIAEVEEWLRLRIKKHGKDPRVQALGEKIDKLRKQMEESLITSLEFLKKLLDAAKEILEIEKENPNLGDDDRAKAKAALTDLFMQVKGENTPKIVESIVNDIDEQVVKLVRAYTNIYQTIDGPREIRKQVRSILWIRYKIKDPAVFEKTMGYIEQYYH